MIATVLTVAAVTLGGVAVRDVHPAAAPVAPAVARVASAAPITLAAAPVARSSHVSLSLVGGSGVIHVPAARSRRFRLDPAGSIPRPAVAAPAQVRPHLAPPGSGPTGSGGPAVAAAVSGQPWLARRPCAGPRHRSPPGLPGRAPPTRPG